MNTFFFFLLCVFVFVMLSICVTMCAAKVCSRQAARAPVLFFTFMLFFTRSPRVKWTGPTGNRTQSNVADEANKKKQNQEREQRTKEYNAIFDYSRLRMVHAKTCWCAQRTLDSICIIRFSQRSHIHFGFWVRICLCCASEEDTYKNLLPRCCRQRIFNSTKIIS